MIWVNSSSSVAPGNSPADGWPPTICQWFPKRIDASLKTILELCWNIIEYLYSIFTLCTYTPTFYCQSLDRMPQNLIILILDFMNLRGSKLTNSPCLCMMSVHTIIGLVRQISRFLLTLLLSSSLTLRLIRWDFVETRHNFKLNTLVFRYIMYIYYTNILLYQVEKMRHFNHYQSCFDIKAFLEIWTFEF